MSMSEEAKQNARDEYFERLHGVEFDLDPYYIPNEPPLKARKVTKIRNL